MITDIKIDDLSSIKELKLLQAKESDMIKSIIMSTNCSTDELLSCLSTVCLIPISEEYHSESNSTVGHALGISAVKTLSQLYQALSPIKYFLIRESDKISSTHQLGDISQEIKETTLLVDDIMQEISKLLICEGFLHSIGISYGYKESEIFIKKLFLKRHSSTIPNPHEIPGVYKTIIGLDQKEIYHIYSNFTNYFSCNWIIGIKRLGKIKKDFNAIHKLCPLIRLSIMKEILLENEMDDVPSDIIKSICALDSQSLIHFHASYITSLIHNSKHHNSTTDLLLSELKKIAEKLTDPFKDVVQFNIIMESTIKSMMIMKELQGHKVLNSSQQQMLQNLEKFFSEIAKQATTTTKEMIAISYKIVDPLMNNVKQNFVTQEKSGGQYLGI